MKQLVFASHVALIEGKEYDGIGNSLKETLSEITDRFVFVRHSMEGGLPSEVQFFRDGVVEKSHNLRVTSGVSVLRYLTEIINTYRYFARNKHGEVFIGIDPLNAFVGVLLRKRGKVEKTIFYTPDYSPRRFKNPLVNKVYHAIDRYCVRHSDEVWSVSRRICEIRKDMGLDEAKNIFLPNVPPTTFDEYKGNPHHRHTLVTSGIIDTQLDFLGAFKAVKALKPKYPKIKLIIFGNGPQQKNLQEEANRLGISDSIEFRGRQPLSVLMKAVSESGVGLALYTGEWAFNEYGDSTKCREYFHFGVPVVSTDSHATVQDIKDHQAGVVVEQNNSSYVEAISSIFENYEDYSRQSQELGDKYAGEHKRQLEKVLS